MRRVRVGTALRDGEDGMKTIDVEKIALKGWTDFPGVSYEEFRTGKVAFKNKGKPLEKVKWVPQTIWEQVWITFNDGTRIRVTLRDDHGLNLSIIGPGIGEC